MGSTVVQFIIIMPPGHSECHLYIIDSEIKICILKMILHIFKSSHFCIQKEALCLNVYFGIGRNFIFNFSEELCKTVCSDVKTL